MTATRQEDEEPGLRRARGQLSRLRLRLPGADERHARAAPRRRHRPDRPRLRSLAGGRSPAHGRVGQAPLLVELEDAARERSRRVSPRVRPHGALQVGPHAVQPFHRRREERDRKSTRLNSSHVKISYAVFCLKKKKKRTYITNCEKKCNIHLQNESTRFD